MFIINADDFGFNVKCTDAIAEAFEKGYISDTTLMANGEAFDYAVQLCKEKGFENNIGVHFNLTECVPLNEDMLKLPAFTENGKFHGKINRLKPLTKAEKTAVYNELCAQVKKITGSGIKITHADSHHHIHTSVFIIPIVLKVCRENGIDKIRIHRNIGNISQKKLIVKKIFNRCLKLKGFKTLSFFGSADDISFVSDFDNTEIMVHPVYDKNGLLIDKQGELDGFDIGYDFNAIFDYKKINLRGYRLL